MELTNARTGDPDTTHWTITRGSILRRGAQWRTVVGDRSMRHEHMRSVETAARSAREKSTQRRACALARHTAPWRCAVRTSTAPSRVPSRSTVRHTPCAVRRAPRAARWVPCSVPYRGAPRRPAGCRAPCAMLSSLCFATPPAKAAVRGPFGRAVLLIHDWRSGSSGARPRRADQVQHTRARSVRVACRRATTRSQGGRTRSAPGGQHVDAPSRRGR